MATVFQFPYRTVAEVSIRAVLKNLYTLRSLSEKEIIPVVKADAYGHGLVPIAKALVARGSCSMLAVATLEEAIELRKKITQSFSLLVLSGFLPHQLEAYLKYRVIPIIHSLQHLKSLLGRKNLPEIHLKIDTGMHRLGITADEMPEAIRLLQNLEIKLAGVATHFAEGEMPLSNFADIQLERFESWLSELRSLRLLQTDARIHVSNSGGILRKKWGSSTAVRPGLSLFGISPNPRLPHSSDLIPALEWQTRILSLKEIKKGESVGYGRTYRASKQERIALLSIGYADGFPRLLGKKGKVLIAGKKTPIRGRVSMDLTAVDCSYFPSIREGSLVTLIGQQGKEKISAWDLAHWTNTIAWEILCGISARVPRVYLD